MKVDVLRSLIMIVPFPRFHEWSINIWTESIAKDNKADRILLILLIKQALYIYNS